MLRLDGADDPESGPGSFGASALFPATVRPKGTEPLRLIWFRALMGRATGYVTVHLLAYADLAVSDGLSPDGSRRSGAS